MRITNFLMRVLANIILLASPNLTMSLAAQSPAPKIVSDAKAAADWAAKALTASGYNADFTIRSLAEVDRFFDDQAPNGVPKPAGPLADGLGGKIFAIGSYVGETLRRNRGGEWSGDDADAQAEINIAVVLPDHTRFWPVQRVMKRFKNGREDGLVAYAAATAEERH